jgi:hypothetical protein
VNRVLSAGKKFISLDACSILTVYKGVFAVEEFAPIHAAANTTRPAAATRSDIFCGLFILTHPFLSIPFKRKTISNF